MAKPIKETPILSGKDAKEFNKNHTIVKFKRISKKYMWAVAFESTTLRIRTVLNK